MRNINKSQWTVLVAAFVVIVAFLLVTNNSEPEEKTCEEWITYVLTEAPEDFSSDVGTACMYAGDRVDWEKSYTVEELNEIAEEYRESSDYEGYEY